MITNYLDPESFKKLIDAIPLVTEYNKSRLTNRDNIVPDPKLIQAVAWIQYCHGLRITEALACHSEDFDLEMKVLTLNRTKTGFEKCKCSKWKKRKLIQVDENCKECLGIGKVRIPQFTSIPPDLPNWVIDFIKNKNDKLFSFNRQLIYEYYKKAAEFANLQLGEQQKKRKIKGMWTHAIRKARSKYMKELGADRELRMCKLRHSHKDAHDAYDASDINALIKWEAEHLS